MLLKGIEAYLREVMQMKELPSDDDLINYL